MWHRRARRHVQPRDLRAPPGVWATAPLSLRGYLIFIVLLSIIVLLSLLFYYLYCSIITARLYYPSSLRTSLLFFPLPSPLAFLLILSSIVVLMLLIQLIHMNIQTNKAPPGVRAAARTVSEGGMTRLETLIEPKFLSSSFSSSNFSIRACGPRLRASSGVWGHSSDGGGGDAAGVPCPERAKGVPRSGGRQ